MKVHEISGNGSHTCLFEVDIQETSQNKLVEKRNKFQRQLLNLFERQAYSISRPIELVLYVQVHVTDHQQRENNSQTKFLVASRVGLQSEEVHVTSEALKVLPWVGVALQLNRQEVSDSGRVFCVLPMPPDVQCHLPVHVNGTFSLNDERRALKWQGLETRNDHSAKWNNLIITHLLPLCYALLLEHAKMLLKPNEFFQAWPNATTVCRTHWEGLLKPLFENLFTEPVFWSQSPQQEKGLWLRTASAIFAPFKTDVPDVIRLALWPCKEKLVCAHEKVWSALEYMNIPTNTVTPQLIRSKLKQFPNNYVKFTPEQKIDLLKYCLSDGSQAYSDLSNLSLLPLANGTFTFFQSSFSFLDKLYLCSSECPLYLLPNLEGELVDIEEKSNLFTMLKGVADSGYTQLKFLESADIAHLLPKAMPQEWRGQQVVTLPHPRFPMEWVKTFWEWVTKRQLHLFSNQLIVPVHRYTSHCTSFLQFSCCVHS